MTCEKLSWPVWFAQAMNSSPCSETNQNQQQNTLLWPFPCSGIPVPNTNWRICQSSCIWSLWRKATAPLKLKTSSSCRGAQGTASCSLPFNTWDWPICGKSWTKVRSLRTYWNSMATSVLSHTNMLLPERSRMNTLTVNIHTHTHNTVVNI